MKIFDCSVHSKFRISMTLIYSRANERYVSVNVLCGTNFDLKEIQNKVDSNSRHILEIHNIYTCMFSSIILSKALFWIELEHVAAKNNINCLYLTFVYQIIMHVLCCVHYYSSNCHKKLYSNNAYNI